MKIIIAPDKFKGSLTSFEVCDAVAAGIHQTYPSAEVLKFPMADGGDGFSTGMAYYRQTQTVSCLAADPLGRTIKAGWQWDKKNNTAIIEMAVASGLVLLTPEERNPLKTSSRGTGEMIRDAMHHGVEKIILGLGGSATNDAGTGILAALGFVFLDNNNDPLLPCG